MSHSTLPESAALPASPSLFGQPSPPRDEGIVVTTPITSAAIVRQEANLLRFPFFALGRKGLRNHKGLFISGQSKLDNESYDFEYCITCNTNDVYPGQLARKVHMGLLRVMQAKQPFPFANPIEFTWRELMETIGILPGGRTVHQLKQAIRSIEGTRIRSKFALKNAEGQHLKSRERGYGLYSDYVFCDELLPDNKTIADKNFLWLADWYLNNINSLYCSPLDHSLWQSLDEESPIASRLYEFFTFNFTGDWQTLTIDYQKLARFLPVVEKTHLSQIEQQFGPALSLIIQAEILAQATWQKGKRGQPQLNVRRGRLLTKRGLAKGLGAGIGEIESTEIRELYRQETPEDELVSQFHQLWSKDESIQSTNAERTLAREILKTYGLQQAEKLLPLVVEIMREHFPGAKSFGGTRRYWQDAAKQLTHELSAVERHKQAFIQEELEYAKASQDKANFARWQTEWDGLQEKTRQEIRSHVLSSCSPRMHLEKYPALLHRFCLRELGRRQQSTAAA